MAEKKQNPYEELGRYEEETTDHPPAYTAEGPSTQQSRSPPESFLAFLDQLNKDIAASPPLQVLDATGGILNSVPILFPLHWIGSAVSGLANMSSQGMSKSRTDSALKQANKDIFGPRGLRVEIAKLDALAHVAKLPILDSQGKVNRQAPLFLQLQNEAYMADAVANEREQQELNLGKRIWALQPWIAELEYEVLPWSSKSKLTRFNDSLKKYNEPKDQERKGMGMGRRDRERRSMGMGMGMGKRADVYSQGTKQEDPFKKALWLIIREVEMGERP
ncbi:unnamed protein product [Penicillium glandicola]